MAFSRYDKSSLAEQAMWAALRERLIAQGVSEQMRHDMRFTSSVEHRAHDASTHLRLGWSDPEDHSRRRYLDLRIDDLGTNLDEMGRGADMAISNLDIRGELYFFKLSRHFPQALRSVKCLEPGRLRVTFKNDREIDTDEEKVDTPEFIAACGMIYDL